MSLLQEVIQLMTKNWCDSKSIKYLANRGEEELNMIKSAYEKKLPKAKYPEPIKKVWAKYNIPHKSENNIFKPQTLEEFLEITNKLERQWILSEGYDGYYDEWCTITVQWNRYYTN